MSSSFFSSPAIQRRSVQSANNPVSADSLLRSVIDPPPKPWPFAQFLAFGFILFLGCLQLLPATHLRDPSDPFGKWIPLNPDPSFSFSNSGASSGGNSGIITTHGGEDGITHIVSWMDCLDLRVLAVLTNSTLSSSRYSDQIYFHFFIPEGKEDKVSYYKLKVLFPHSKLEILGQKEVEEKLKIGTSVGEYAGPSLNEIAPFVIPRIHKHLSRFIYVSPDIIVKGRIEELFGIDLSNYAIAAAEDCTKKLSTYVNFDVLDALQRSASKPWVSRMPYEKNDCTPVLSVLLIDARKLEKDLVEAILWWSKVLNRNERSNQTNPAVVLALYNRYLKLPASWMVGDSTSSKTNERRILRFDGSKNVCSELGSGGNPESDLGSLWKKYLPPLSDRILGS